MPKTHAFPSPVARRLFRALGSGGPQPAPQALSKPPALRIECRRCGRSVPVLEFTISEQGLSITCPSCHGRFLLEPPAPAEDGGRGNRFKCPKCLRIVRSESESCPKCGLIFALWEKGLARAPMFSGAGSKDPCAEKLWEKVEDLPEEEAVHEAFLAYCQESRQLDLAAHRYQAFLYKKPESRLGTAYRDRIILLAQFNPRPARRPRHSPRRFSGLKTALVLGLIALLWGLVMIPMILER